MGEPWRHATPGRSSTRSREVSGHDVADLLLHADDETLRRTDRAQIATFALEMVVLAHFAAHDDRAAPRRRRMPGHSLGEYSALVAAGIIDVARRRRLVAARGRGDARGRRGRPGHDDRGDRRVRPTRSRRCSRRSRQRGAQVWIANLNAPDQTVVAGDEDGIEQANEALRATGKVVRLAVGGAFHSPLDGARPNRRCGPH